MQILRILALPAYGLQVLMGLAVQSQQYRHTFVGLDASLEPYVWIPESVHCNTVQPVKLLYRLGVFPRPMPSARQTL